MSSLPTRSAPADRGPSGAAASADTERVLRRLELTVVRRLDGLLQGDHLGLLPGPGSEPASARPYLVLRTDRDWVRDIARFATVQRRQARARRPPAVLRSAS